MIFQEKKKKTTTQDFKRQQSLRRHSTLKGYYIAKFSKSVPAEPLGIRKYEHSFNELDSTMIIKYMLRKKKPNKHLHELELSKACRRKTDTLRTGEDLTFEE